MQKHRVTFLPNQKSIEIQRGTSLLEASQRADVFVNNLCGGEGVCGECRVHILTGERQSSDRASAFFSQEEIEKGFVLACQTKVLSDLEVEIPLESRLEEEQIMTGEGRESAEIQGGTSPERIPEAPFYPFKPLIRKVYLELPPRPWKITSRTSQGSPGN